MARQDFSGPVSEQPDITSGELGESAGVTHMRAFLKAMKAGDPKAMWSAFEAGQAECSPADYGPMDKDDALGKMMG